MDELVRMSGEIDVHFITGEPGVTKGSPVLVKPKGIRFHDYGNGLFVFYPGYRPFLFDTSLPRTE